MRRASDIMSEYSGLYHTETEVQVGEKCSLGDVGYSMLCNSVRGVRDTDVESELMGVHKKITPFMYQPSKDVLPTGTSIESKKETDVSLSPAYRMRGPQRETSTFGRLSTEHFFTDPVRIEPQDIYVGHSTRISYK
jgi:hypothetical protein